MAYRWIWSGLALTGLAIGLAACAMTPEQIAAQKASQARELSSTLGDRVPGKPETCIDVSGISGPQIIGNNLVYRLNGKLWVSHIEGCPSLDGDPLLISELHGSRMCENDSFRTLVRGTSIPSGVCRFGKFTPYSHPKR